MNNRLTLKMSTLGLTSDSAIVSIAALLWNDMCNLQLVQKAPVSAIVDKVAYFKFDLGSQKSSGDYTRTFDKDTVTWWTRQPNDIKSELSVKGGEQPVNSAIFKLDNYIKRSNVEPRKMLVYVRGCSFVMPIIENVYMQTDRNFCKLVAPHYNYRDIGTIIDFATDNGTFFKLPKQINEQFNMSCIKNKLVYDIYQFVYANAALTGELDVNDYMKSIDY